MALTSAQLAGQHLMLGIPEGLALEGAICLFQETQAAGLIVFRRNFKSATDFKGWLAALEKGLGRRLLVAVDHEGGRVIHLCEDVTYFPDNLVLGWTGSEEYARRQGELEAGQLCSLGIDLNLAPTVDVLTASYSPNIGIRSYGKEADLVARLGAARIQGMQTSGLSACAKHFPGQGQSPLDAHLDLPVLATEKKEYDLIHSVPFKAAIEAGVETIMTSHPVYPELDTSDKVPATFSRRIVTDFLRGELGFQGVILSDDLEMGALKNYGSIGECAVRAVLAGHDMVLICSDPGAAREAARQLTQAYEDKVIPQEFSETSGERVRALCAKRKTRFKEAHKSLSEGRALALKIAREGISKSQDKSGVKRMLWTDPGTRRIVLYPQLSVLGEKIAMESEMKEDTSFIENLLKSTGVSASVLTMALEPSEQEQAVLLESTAKADEVIYFCFDPHLYQGSKQLLNSLEAAAKNLKVIFLRDPFGADLLVRQTSYLCALGFRSVQIQAALELLACHPRGGEDQNTASASLRMTQR